MIRTLVGALAAVALAASVAVAGPTAVAGTAVAVVPACTSYERALLAASADRGQLIRLACVTGLDV